MAIGGVLVAATAASCNVMHANKSNLEASAEKDRADDNELHVELAVLGAVVAATIRHVCVCVCVCVCVWSLCRATLESPCQHPNGVCPELAAVTRERLFVVSEWRVLFFFLFSEH